MKRLLLAALIICGIDRFYIVASDCSEYQNTVLDNVWCRVERLFQSCKLLDAYSSPCMPSSSRQFGISRAELVIREATHLIEHIARVNGLSDICRRGFAARALRYYEHANAFRAGIMSRIGVY